MFLFPALNSAIFLQVQALRNIFFKYKKRICGNSSEKSQGKTWERASQQGVSASLLALEHEHQNCHPAPTLHYPPPLNKQINHTVKRAQH